LGVDGVNIYGVVRFIDRLPHDDPHSAEPGRVELPYSEQYMFDWEEDADSIKKLHIIPFLRETTKFDHYSEIELRQDSPLFMPTVPKEVEWDLQLWVLPQPASIRKMYKFPTGRKGSTNCLGEFLDPEKVAKGDRRVYMEAHVVAKPA
jgi:hypothetical protein